MMVETTCRTSPSIRAQPLLRELQCRQVSFPPCFGPARCFRPSPQRIGRFSIGGSWQAPKSICFSTDVTNKHGQGSFYCPGKRAVYPVPAHGARSCVLFSLAGIKRENRKGLQATRDRKRTDKDIVNLNCRKRRMYSMALGRWNPRTVKPSGWSARGKTIQSTICTREGSPFHKGESPEGGRERSHWRVQSR